MSVAGEEPPAEDGFKMAEDVDWGALKADLVLAANKLEDQLSLLRVSSSLRASPPRTPLRGPPSRNRRRARPRDARDPARLALTSPSPPPLHPRDARFSTARPTTGPGWSRGCRCDPTSRRRIFPPSRARRPLTSADGSSRRETDRVSRRAARSRGGVPRAIHVARPSPSPHHHAPVIARPPRFALHAPPVCTLARAFRRASLTMFLSRRKRARRRVSETPLGFCLSAATARRGS